MFNEIEKPAFPVQGLDNGMMRDQSGREHNQSQAKRDQSQR